MRLAAPATDLGDVVVTGSRAAAGRSNVLTTAPVDVISAREIRAFAQTDVSQVLTYAAPVVSVVAPGLFPMAPTSWTRPACAAWAPTRCWCS
ncbi:MAG: hypothetical protein WKG07_27025 [Hymenobacter sp.]